MRQITKEVIPLTGRERQFEKSSLIWEILHDTSFEPIRQFLEAEDWVSSWIREDYCDVGLSLDVESFISHTNSNGFSLAIALRSISLAVRPLNSKKNRIEKITVSESGSMCCTIFTSKFDWNTFIDGRFLDSLEDDLFEDFDSYLFEIIKSWMYAKGYLVWQVEGHSLLEAQINERLERKKALREQLQEGLPDYAIDITDFMDF